MKQTRGRRAVVAVGVVVVGLTPVACSSDAKASCAEMRAELATLSPDAKHAWENIEKLQDEVEHALQLRAEIERRCA
jgi:hypothetical protein